MTSGNINFGEGRRPTKDGQEVYWRHAASIEQSSNYALTVLEPQIAGMLAAARVDFSQAPRLEQAGAAPQYPIEIDQHGNVSTSGAADTTSSMADQARADIQAALYGQPVPYAAQWEPPYAA